MGPKESIIQIKKKEEEEEAGVVLGMMIYAYNPQHLGGWRQEVCKFEASLGCITKLFGFNAIIKE
jgi:hypothetical protein